MLAIIPIPVPYEWIERLFGSYIADNFNTISFTLFCLGFLCWAIFGRKSPKRAVRKSIPVQQQREFNYCIDENGHIVPEKSVRCEKFEEPTKEPPIAESYFGQYDRYSDLTDEEMKLAMQMHLNRDNPTFEEWKAQQLKEKQNNEQHPVS